MHFHEPWKQILLRKVDNLRVRRYNFVHSLKIAYGDDFAVFAGNSACPWKRRILGIDVSVHVNDISCALFLK